MPVGGENEEGPKERGKGEGGWYAGGIGLRAGQHDLLKLRKAKITRFATSDPGAHQFSFSSLFEALMRFKRNKTYKQPFTLPGFLLPAFRGATGREKKNQHVSKSSAPLGFSSRIRDCYVNNLNSWPVGRPPILSEK